MTEGADIGEGEDSDDVLCAFESGNDEPEINPFDDDPTYTGELNSSDGWQENNALKSTSPACVRPLVRKRSSTEAKGSFAAQIIELYVLQVMQNQARRDEEKAKKALEREEERKWRQERHEERLRREEGKGFGNSTTKRKAGGREQAIRTFDGDVHDVAR